MVIFWVALILSLLISGTMVGFGFLFYKKPPTEINSLFGYRSSMSSKNRETWEFAHNYSGKFWIIAGIVTFVVTLVLLLVFKDSTAIDTVGLVLVYLQPVALLSVIPPTEVALRKNFDKDGNRKSNDGKN